MPNTIIFHRSRPRRPSSASSQAALVPTAAAHERALHLQRRANLEAEYRRALEHYVRTNEQMPARMPACMPACLSTACLQALWTHWSEIRHKPARDTCLACVHAHLPAPIDSSALRHSFGWRRRELD